MLLESTYMPNMVKISLYGCAFSLVLDGLWLFMYSDTYLNSSKNSGLIHELKAFFQYIWFVTMLQVFLKAIYIYFTQVYELKNVKLIEVK